MQLPKDITIEERKIIDYAIVEMYQQLGDPTDKFIFCMLYEMGRDRSDVSRALGLSMITICKRVANIRRVLSVSYRDRLKKTVEIT
jgi:hypothetical protein